MNLEEVVDPEFGLRQNAWTLEMPRFGKTEQIVVVGWSGYHPTRTSQKNFIVHCSVCEKDRELHGGGYFKAPDYALRRGAIPCGCSKRPSWSEQQYKVLCQRYCSQYNHKFIELKKDSQDNRCRVTAICEEHGEWTTKVSNFLFKKGCCPKCGKKRTGLALRGVRKKSDETVIDKFFASGKYPVGTIFCRSERVDKAGQKGYWLVKCPKCLYISEATTSALNLGQRVCECSNSRQEEAYVNFVIKEDIELPVAIKFGISNNALARTKVQNLRTNYLIVNYCVYKFPTASSCKQAELECKKLLECGVVDQEDMKDGWTETTWVYNLDNVLEIYRKFDGVSMREGLFNQNAKA